MIAVRQPATLDEALKLATYCTGMGRSWAERTTTLRGSGGAQIDTVSVWVQVAVDNGRPAPLTDQFRQHYGEACGGRKVSARLGLAGPTDSVTARPWMVRRTDLDPFNHVNNAANWAFLEEVTAAAGCSRAGIAEMEFVAPVDLDTAVELHHEREGHSCAAWLTNDGAVRSAARWHQP
jgi:acyl-ACP thioesterase